MLRYSDNSIFYNLTQQPDYCYSPHNITTYLDHAQFYSKVNELMEILQLEAAGTSSKFANASMPYTHNVMIHGLVQCTPDLSVQQCNECLNHVLGVVFRCFLGKSGAKAATPSCNVRYDITVASPPNSGRHL